MSTEGLDVRDVVSQFKESEQTLHELRERLQAIVLAEEGADRAAASIEEVSRVLAASARSLESAVAELENIRSTTVTALAAARQFLSGTDLGSLRAEVLQLTTETREGMAQVRAEVAALAKEIPRAEQARIELEALKEKIPVRTRKKLGI